MFGQNLKILVVEKHEITLEGTILWLRSQYPDAEFMVARTADEALKQVRERQPHLLLIEPTMPQKSQREEPRVEYGHQVLKEIMRCYPNMNIAVQTTFVKALRRIKPQIDNHRGGFTIIDKRSSSKEMLMRVELALHGVTYTKDLPISYNDMPPAKSQNSNNNKLAYYFRLLSLRLIRFLPEDYQGEIYTVRKRWCKSEDSQRSIELKTILYALDMLKGYIHVQWSNWIDPPKKIPIVPQVANLRTVSRGLEFRPEWVEVMKLAYQEGLQDKAIAERMNISPRTVLGFE